MKIVWWFPRNLLDDSRSFRLKKIQFWRSRVKSCPGFSISFANLQGNWIPGYDRSSNYRWFNRRRATCPRGRLRNLTNLDAENRFASCYVATDRPGILHFPGRGETKPPVCGLVTGSYLSLIDVFLPVRFAARHQIRFSYFQTNFTASNDRE